MEIKIGKRTAQVKFLEKRENLMIIEVDQKVYEVDVMMVGDMIYSLIYQGESFNIEMIQGSSPNKYDVNTLYNSYQIEIIDQAARLRSDRHADGEAGDENHIITPMPAKIVSIPVSEGQEVAKGTTLIVVSAMKMEIEHKAPRDCKIRKIFVKEEDTVNVNEVLIEFEG
ncbi:MAG TPA: acetyl-CoA carboxylase biotin carboxyl carrier protein subunit [Bacteroidales bacterium]|nr:acetyl-CoA carboxylase biotin carboxyl carrier protein subunit [Bacteroidales bacterium]HSA43982.1 acetyl-CoA carboxylase biotin carboxyl carrier protein subunit [Bacteroidales bacterium]